MKILVVFGFAAVSCIAQDPASLIDGMLPDLVATYKDLHSHPELSHQEARTSAAQAGELRKAGYTVTERLENIPTVRRPTGLWPLWRTGQAHGY